MDTPILLLVFNRADTTRRVFEAVRQARPSRLYVAADGPRAHKDGEAQRCEEVRRIATAVDWPCEVRTLFRERNLGCKQGVSQGIGWFFQHEPEGIVLEDDILPVPGFFTYCEELLARYRDDERVHAICGCNLIGDRYAPDESYFFSQQNHVWGWASWRRAWQHYDVDLAGFPAWDRAGGLATWLEGDGCATAYWRQRFMRMVRREVDTWDYQWHATGWMRGGLCVLPAHNLTDNLGFGPAAGGTHTTKGPPPEIVRNPAREIALPLRHPSAVARDRRADALIRRHVTHLTHARCLKRGIGLFFKRLAGRGDR